MTTFNLLSLSSLPFPSQPSPSRYWILFLSTFIAILGGACSDPQATHTVSNMNMVDTFPSPSVPSSLIQCSAQQHFFHTSSNPLQ